MSDNSSSTSPANSPEASAPVVTKRRPIPRKGHTKSRAGCISCKRRKVKCDEVSPTCGSCERLGLSCQYLTKQKQGSPLESLSLARPLRAEPSTFDMDDMRFFRHFLFNAYPPLPVDGFMVWQQVSQLSHEHEFLMHAMLGLAASHLNLVSHANYEEAALKHRVVAIKALNEHLSKPDLSMPEAEAAFAAILSLTFQSAYMPEGMTDFLTMIRGLLDLESSNFSTFARDAYVAKIRNILETHYLPEDQVDARIVEKFCLSTKRLAPLCRSAPGLEYLAHMQKIANLAVTDPATSFHELSFFYDKVGNLSPEDFASFIDPDNPISQLVIMHMLVLDFVMVPHAIEHASMINSSLGFKKGYDCRKAMSRLWIEQIYHSLPSQYRQYGEWLYSFTQTLVLAVDQDQVWKPFLLTRGMVTLPAESRSLHALGQSESPSEDACSNNSVLNGASLPVGP